MDKDFATLFAETEAEMVEETSDSTETDEVEEVVEETEEVEEETEAEVGTQETEETDEVEESSDEKPEESEKKSTDKKTFEKMAGMRVELKKAKEVEDKFDSIAKEMGFKDANELLEKTEEKLMIQKAQKEGKTVEDVKKDIERDKEIAELKARLNESDQKEIDNRYSAVVTEFVTGNKLSDTEVKRIEEELVSDGFTEKQLKSMLPKPLRKLFDSYLKDNSNKQKELEEKAKLKKEIPLDQNSGNADSEEDEVNKLYNQLKRKEE